MHGIWAKFLAVYAWHYFRNNTEFSLEYPWEIRVAHPI
jgi:hypothetical protein